MNIRELAPQFTIYVFARDVDRGAGVKVALSRAGYDAYFFEDQLAMVERIQGARPHLVVLATASVRDSLSTLVEGILKASPESRFIFLARKDQFNALTAYGAYGLEDFTADEPEGLEARVVFSADRACERLYLTYQNEALLEQVEKARAAADAARARIKALESESAASAAIPSAPLISIEERVREYLSAGSKEELLQRYLGFSSEAPLVYLKFLPTMKSLVVTHATATGADKLNGVGCQLAPEEARDFANQVALGVVPPSVGKLLAEAFAMKNASLWPLFLSRQLEGVVAFSRDADPQTMASLRDEFSLFSTLYANFAMERRLEALEVQDPVTEVFNRAYFRQKTSDEWSRARRIRQPLSVVKVALDDFYELEQALGEAARDGLLKNLAQLIVKTSRTNDLTCRTGTNEFAMILPHCHRQGAMIRAERLRRFVENSQILENGLKISISLGISEYPSLCSTAEDLDTTSTKALAHIMERGGNRLCLSKAPVDHRPEFEVAVEGGEA